MAKFAPVTFCARKGIFVSAWRNYEASGCGERSGTILETRRSVSRALEAKVAQDGIVLTEAQVAALEAAKEEKEASRRNRDGTRGISGLTRHILRGHDQRSGAYLSTDVRRYLHSSRLLQNCTCRSTRSRPPDLLNDRVILPFFDEHGIPLLRILTDRGTEYCGKKDQHEYQLYLAIEDVDHTKTKTKRPQTNGICERFHKTMLEEFLSDRVPKEDLQEHGRVASRSRRLAR